jgi:hypothetical protein
MSWFVFPEDHGTNSDIPLFDGDKNDAAAFAFALYHTAVGVDVVTEGWDVSVDTDAYEATISQGTAVLTDSGAHAYEMNIDLRLVAYVAQTDAPETVSLTNSTENTIWAHLPLTSDDAGEFRVTIPGDDPPPEPALKIETVDLS